VLIFEVEGMFICLFSSLEVFNLCFFSFRREGLYVEGLSLRERKFDLRGSLDGRHGGRLGGLGRSPW